MGTLYAVEGLLRSPAILVIIHHFESVEWFSTLGVITSPYKDMITKI